MLLKIFSNIEKSRPCGFGQSLGQPKNNCPVSGNFWSISYSFGRPIVFGQSEPDQKKSETDQKFPETRQFYFGRPKKMRKRPDNWSTKRLTKTTWTGL